MSEPKLKADKEAGKLAQTSRTFIKEMFLEKEFGFNEPVMTDEMMKGLLCEQDSLGLVQQVLKGEFRIKNISLFSNEILIGTPDIVLQKEDFIEDVKTSWSLKTFFNVGDPDSDEEKKMSKLYYYQALAYMKLTGKKNYRLIYCLIPTPSELITEQKKRIFFKFGCDEENPSYKEMSMQIDHNNNLITKLPAEKRIKVFTFPFSESDYKALETQAYKGIEYYKTLHL